MFCWGSGPRADVFRTVAGVDGFCFGGLKRFVPPLPLYRHVCYWHLADVPTALTNVCFEGKNGHDAGVTPMSAFDPFRT